MKLSSILATLVSALSITAVPTQIVSPTTTSTALTSIHATPAHKFPYIPSFNDSTPTPDHPASECKSPRCQPPMPFPPGHSPASVAPAPTFFPATDNPILFHRSEDQEDEKVPNVRNTNEKPFVPYYPANWTLAHGSPVANHHHKTTHVKTVTKTVARTTIFTNATVTVSSPPCTMTVKQFGHRPYFHNPFHYTHPHLGPKTVYNSTVTSLAAVDCKGCALAIKTVGLGHGPVELKHGNKTVTTISTKTQVVCRPSYAFGGGYRD